MPDFAFISMRQIKPNPHPVQTHCKGLIDEMAELIKATHVMPTIEVDEELQILRGTLEHLAATKLGLLEVPVQIHKGLSEAEKRVFAMGAVKIPQRAGWDRKATAGELIDIKEILIASKVEIDIQLTGFSAVEIDQLMVDLTDRSEEPADRVNPATEATVAKPGDIFALGDHKIMCGDSSELAALERLMGKEKADAAINDMPFNRLIGDIGNRGRTSHENFAMASGELSRAEFYNKVGQWMRNSLAISRGGAVHYWHADWRCVAEMILAGREIYGDMLNLITWVKTNAGMGSFYRSQHEMIGVFRVGMQSHRNNVQLGRFGRTRSNVWTYAGTNGFRAGRMDDLQAHPTVKPVAMIADAMRDCTKRDDLVIDLFCGSGTTLLAAERVGRRAYCVEIDPRYVDVAIRRWQDFTKKDAVLLDTAQTFDELEAEGRKACPRVRLIGSADPANSVSRTKRVRLNVAV